MQPGLPVQATQALVVHCGLATLPQSVLAMHSTQALTLHFGPTVEPAQLASLLPQEPHEPPQGIEVHRSNGAVGQIIRLRVP